MYKYLIRPLLFYFDPEKIHYFSIAVLSFLIAIPGVKRLLKAIYQVKDPKLKREVLGLTFTNPVGLAAGFDKDARMIDQLEPLGFGFIEIGTLTPKAQVGNPKPRLFRLKEDLALINRMGFNNYGVDQAVLQLQRRKSKIIIGGNIGKNKNTDNDIAIEDYEYSFEALFDVVDYFVVNVSSPNTPGLRALQSKEALLFLLKRLQICNGKKHKRKPILLKIAPDLDNDQLKEIVEVVLASKINGIIATNTTISRDGLTADGKVIEKIGAGGLSGFPLRKKATQVIEFLRKELGSDAIIIGVGGIMTPDDAIEKIRAGANLIQIYSGFIYNGPSFVKKINRAILKAGV